MAAQYDTRVLALSTDRSFSHPYKISVLKPHSHCRENQRHAVASILWGGGYVHGIYACRCRAPVGHKFCHEQNLRLPRYRIGSQNQYGDVLMCYVLTQEPPKGDVATIDQGAVRWEW